eukprot:158844_1
MPLRRTQAHARQTHRVPKPQVPTRNDMQPWRPNLPKLKCSPRHSKKPPFRAGGISARSHTDTRVPQNGEGEQYSPVEIIGAPMIRQRCVCESNESGMVGWCQCGIG